jgi:general secretion pathway protein L
MIPYQSSIGIEIREDAMILVHLRRTLKETKVQNSLILPLSFPLSPEAEADVVDSLKRFLHHNSVKPERIVVGIPRKSVILKSMEIPSLEKKNIPQLLEYEIERHLPFKPEEIYYDFEVIEKTGENLYRVLLVAVKKEMIDSLRDLFERVPIRPMIFDLSSFAIFNALRFGNGFSEDMIEAIIFLGSKDVELEIVQGGLLMYSRSLGLKDEDSVGELSTELESAISTIDAKGKEKKFNKVILSGPGALRPGLIESIKEKISSDTRMEDLSNKVTMRPMEPQDRYTLIPAIGLALRGLGEVGLKINFLPHGPEIERGKRGLSLAIILTGIVIFLGLTIIVSGVSKDSFEMRDIEKKMASLKPEATAIEKIQVEIKKIEEKRMILDKVEENDLSKLDILAELTRVIPPEAWLVSLDYTETQEQQKGAREANGKIKREIIISGFATSASKLIPLMEDSPIFENVEFAGSITSGVDGKERFRIKALSRKAALGYKPEVLKEEVPKKDVLKKESPRGEMIKEEVQNKEGIKEEPLGPTEPAKNPMRPMPPGFRSR